MLLDICGLQGDLLSPVKDSTRAILRDGHIGFLKFRTKRPEAEEESQS